MANSPSVGKLRPLLNRRPRIGEQPLTEQKTSPVGKPTQPEPNNLPAVQDGKSNLHLEPRTSEDDIDSLNAKSEFLDRISTDSSQDSTASAQDELRKSPGMPKDKLAEVSDDGFRSYSAEPRTVLHLRPLGNGAYNVERMGDADKQRVQPSAPEPLLDFGPGISIVEKSVKVDEKDETFHMGLAERQTQRPTSVVKAEAVDSPLGEIVDQLYKEKEEAARKADATPTSTPQQPAANAGPVQSQSDPVTGPPDTRNDHKIALQEQVKESVDDLKFWADIEKRLKAIVDTYDDPKGEVKALYEGTQQLVQDLGKLYNKFKDDYEQQYGNADPMKGQLEDLSKLGQGDESQPRERTGDGSRRTKQQPIDSKEYARLRRDFQNSVVKDSKRANTSKEDDDDLDLRQYTVRAKNIRRQTEELEETARNDKRKKEQELRESTDSSQELIENSEAEKSPVLIKVYGETDTESEAMPKELGSADPLQQ